MPEEYEDSVVIVGGDRYEETRHYLEITAAEAQALEDLKAKYGGADLVPFLESQANVGASAKPGEALDAFWEIYEEQATEICEVCGEKAFELRFAIPLRGFKGANACPKCARKISSLLVLPEPGKTRPEPVAERVANYLKTRNKETNEGGEAQR